MPFQGFEGRLKAGSAAHVPHEVAPRVCSGAPPSDRFWRGASSPGHEGCGTPHQVLQAPGVGGHAHVTHAAVPVQGCRRHVQRLRMIWQVSAQLSKAFQQRRVPREDKEPPLPPAPPCSNGPSAGFQRLPCQQGHAQSAHAAVPVQGSCHHDRCLDVSISRHKVSGQDFHKEGNSKGNRAHPHPLHDACIRTVPESECEGLTTIGPSPLGIGPAHSR